ncbi:DUF4190 domain-containing protein [Verrucomicrobiaceae bacterium 227]
MKDWYYGKYGQQFGPIDESTLRARIATSEIGRNDLIWCEGMPVWLPLREMSEFFESAEPPPMPLGSEVPKSSSGDSASPYATPVTGLMGNQGAGPPLPKTNGLAIASLVCGILSLVTFCFCGGLFFGLPAVICGHMSMGQIKSGNQQQDGHGMALAGLICGYIGLGVFLLMMLGNGVNYSSRGF